MAYESESYSAPDIAAKFARDPAVCTPGEIDALCDTVIKQSQKGEVPDWVKTVLPYLLAAGKLALTLASCIMLMVALGCAPTPEVKTAEATQAKVLAHFILNCDKRESGWQQQVRESENKDIEGRYARDLAQIRADAALDKAKAIDAVLEIEAAHLANRASLETKIVAAQADYIAMKAEALQVAKLNSALQQWIERKTITAEDMQAIAQTIAQQAADSGALDQIKTLIGKLFPAKTTGK